MGLVGDLVGEYDEFRVAASEIALEAGQLLLEMRQQGIRVSRKGAVDLVTTADLAAEQLIKERLCAKFPDHEILAEESGGESTPGRPLWIVDPLDGTTNFAHGYPVFAVSIGLEVEGKIVAGAVYDPSFDELFTAAAGSGAWLNGKPIRVSSCQTLDDALLATGFPYFYRERTDEVLDLFRAFSIRVQGVRRSGAAALDICALACGRLDGFWELGLKPWDTAAGSLILEEAGGTLSKIDGSTFDIRVPTVLATNGLLHEEMLRVASDVS